MNEAARVHFLVSSLHRYPDRTLAGQAEKVAANLQKNIDCFFEREESNEFQASNGSIVLY